MGSTSLRFLDESGKAHVLVLSKKDKKRLFNFMQEIFAGDSFAYTILGSKPVAWATYRTLLPFTTWSAFYSSLDKYNRTMRLGWKTWEKYRHLFTSAYFFQEEVTNHPGFSSILLVNEQAFNAAVDKNKEDFQQVLKSEPIDGKTLLRLAKNHPLMGEVLQGHQALLGIVLGYGRNNSWEFLERSKVRNPLDCVWGEIDEDNAIPEDTTTAYLSLYSCPSFAGDPDTEESLSLKKEYLLTKEKVLSYYKDKDFLEATLSLLAGYRPESDKI